MVGILRDQRGGIGGLLTLPRETWEAIEADLFRVGYFLADIPRRVSWRVVKNMVRHAQRGSAIFAQQTGDAGVWDQADHLLALILDAVRAGNWQRGGGQNAYPEAFPRPGMTPAEPSEPAGTTRSGGKNSAIPVDEFDAWWAMEVQE